MEKASSGEMKPTAGRRMKTSFNLLQNNLTSLSKIAKERKITQTMAIEEAIEKWIGEMTNTVDIDHAIAETNGFIFNRDLAVMKARLGDKVSKFGAVQIVSLYKKLKDENDRKRVFEALGLNDALNQIAAANSAFEQAAIFKDSQLVSYNEFTFANQLKAVQTPLQVEYIMSQISTDAFEKLKKLRPDIFLKESAIDEESEQDQTDEDFDETLNPALETVLAVTALSKTAWQALPKTQKKQIHDAVKNGKVEIAKKIASGIETAAEAVELFP
jgi:hypothetical protein